MTHRIRHAMEFTDTTLSGSGGSTVEADETHIGRRKGEPKRRAGGGHKQKVFSLVERGGKVKSMHIRGSMFAGVKQGLKNVSPDTHLMTDEATMCKNIGKQFAFHQTINHRIKEWKRGNVYANTLASYFLIFKRGMKDVYRHCRGDHLHRYLAELDFRYNHRSALKIDDKERARLALQGIGGKRLTYRRSTGSYS